MMKSDPEYNLAEIDAFIKDIGTSEKDLIPILHGIQKKYNYLPEDILKRIPEITKIRSSEIAGVSTFYDQFRLKPIGQHLIHICIGTACHMKGAELVYDAFRRKLKIIGDEDTDKDKRFTIQKVACLGCCTLAPVVQIDGVTYGHVKPDTVSKVIEDFLALKDKKADDESARESGRVEPGEIRIGFASCCIASGSAQVEEEVEKCLSDIGVKTTVKRVSCVGTCYREPLLEIAQPNQEPVTYDFVAPEDVRNILLNHYKPDSFLKRMTSSFLQNVESRFMNDDPEGFTRHEQHMRDPHIEAYLGRQKHIVMEACGQQDPLNLNEYRNGLGFKGLEETLLNRSPSHVIEQVKASGLRGKGGGGFRTGVKWERVAQIQDDEKYIICNGDEGDPGAFMDRLILESFPYRVIEGMILAAYAVGAHQGYLYIRGEYPLAIMRVSEAIQQCQDAGILGDNIFGSGFNLTLSIMEGAGAFVCGEETALMKSIEGKRGMPVIRPPYPSEKGLWGHSTLVNNCETYATVPWIIRNGSEAMTRLGTEFSHGTKVFSLAGKVVRGGLIEVPMGITIREIVEDIGGGIEEGKAFKAVQIGGPSGGCVPASMADIPIDFEALSEVGAMMGSGGLLVMDENDCMVDIARYFLTFTCDQTCGKCTFCRVGTYQMLEILNKICDGKGKPADLELLEEIALKTKERSLCGLGKAAPNPVLTTLRYFRDEYEAHLKGVCPTGRCKNIITYAINDHCIGCTICAQKCPVGAIQITPYQKHEIDPERCTRCDTCRQVCPNDAVFVQ